MSITKLQSTRNRVCRVLVVIALAVPAMSANLSKGGRIVLIGDSNTELGRYCKPLTDSVVAHYGDWGSGWICAPNSWYMPQGSSVQLGLFQAMDMNEGGRLPPPILAPNGKWAHAINFNASVLLTFNGTAVDVIWLRSPTGGTYTDSIDGVYKKTENTAGALGVMRTSFSGLTAGTHKLRIYKINEQDNTSTVDILAFETHATPAGKTVPGVVHNWGNAWCTASDFDGIDSTVFAQSLQAVAPDAVVILLGTNDYNGSVSAATFKANILKIINRVKAAVTIAPRNILLVSCFKDINQSALLQEYVNTSYPQAASETGIDYWDMYSWFGDYATNNAKGYFEDGVHVNAAGGAVIAAEMWKKLNAGTGPTAAAPARITTRMNAIARGGIPVIQSTPGHGLTVAIRQEVSGTGATGGWRYFSLQGRVRICR